jgi:hypothetical protein
VTGRPEERIKYVVALGGGRWGHCCLAARRPAALLGLATCHVKSETTGEHCHGPTHRALLSAVAFSGKLDINKMSLCVRVLCFVELVLPKVL